MRKQLSHLEFVSGQVVQLLPAGIQAALSHSVLTLQQRYDGRHIVHVAALHHKQRSKVQTRGRLSDKLKSQSKAEPLAGTAGAEAQLPCQCAPML